MKRATWIIGFLLGLVFVTAIERSAVMAQQTASLMPRSNLTQMTYLPDSAAQQVIPLTSGQPATASCPGSSQAGKYKLCETQFSIYVSEKTTEVTTLLEVQGKTILLIRFGSPIDLSDPDWDCHAELDKAGRWRLVSKPGDDCWKTGVRHHFALANGESFAQRYIITVTVTEQQQPPPNQNPIAKFTYSPSEPKVNESVRFDGTDSYDPDGSIERYRWDFGDGSTDSGSVVYRSFSRAGSYRVTLTVTDNKGATNATSKTVTVKEPENKLPTARFTYSPSKPKVGESVRFDGGSSSDPDGTIVRYQWDFGDGSTDSGSVVYHSFSRAGNYRVILTVTDNREGKGSTSETITVIAPPVADFTADPTSGTAPLTVRFTDRSTPAGEITSWRWDFGDGGTSTERNPSYTYRSHGTFTVRLTVRSPGGEDTKTRSNYIEVKPAPVSPKADFTASPTRGPAPLTVQFTDRSTGEITSWSWSFGDGGTSSEKNPRYTYRTPGTYTVRLTVRGPGGENTKSESDYITVIGPPRAPSNLMATVRSQTQIDLSWRDNADNEEGFEIFRKIQGQSYSLLSRAVPANSTSYSDTGLSPNTTYCYQVRAYNTAGSSEFSNEACATIPPTPPPPPPPPTQIPSFDFTATAELGRMAMIPLPDPIKNQLPAVGVRFVELPNTTRRERTSSSLKDVGLDVNPDTGTILGTPNKAGEFQFLLEARSDTTVLAEIWAIITIKRDGPPTPPPPPPPTGMGTLVSGVPQKGTVTAGPKALSEQFTITVLEGTWALLVRLQGAGNVNLHIRLDKPVEVVAGEIVADFSSTSPTGSESISLTGSVQAGTYYIAVENTESSPQNFTILAAVVPVLQVVNSGESVSGKVEPAPLGGRVLALTQYVIEVPEGTKSLSAMLENLGLGGVKLHMRYGKPVELLGDRIVADFSSDAPLGVEAITIAGASLKAGKYYIAVENVEPYAQEFKLTVTLAR